MEALTKLKLTMFGTLAAIIGLASLILMAVLTYLLPSENLMLIAAGSLAFVIIFHLIQWLAGPKIIEALYKVKPLTHGRYGWVKEMVERIAKASGLEKVPEVGIADVRVPNAFAYGNIFTGYKIAVTRGMLEEFPPEEVEAVLAHEMGHIVHRDVEVMMVVSILPAIIFWLGRMLMLFGWWSGGGQRRSEASLLPLVGLALMAFSFIFNLFVLYLSRLREYYADSHAATKVPFGARKLQRALARILVVTGAISRYRPAEVGSITKFKAFLISDPETVVRAPRAVNIDEIVEWIKSRGRLTPFEAFSTHPDPAKRLRFLDQFRQEYSIYV